ncbi:hypothetical protein SeLEV6574_g07479 [Synchytrium endobioticum]|uniref:DUF4470 domain-containing protein n=1 Tax=Synchytrium endobioticum TaxID=286115 RepID=A0A507CLG4_9FUNG|nr:hypothetical protein SeLEV6574_g07479 [Synchytrium endobioticum]
MSRAKFPKADETALPRYPSDEASSTAEPLLSTLASLRITDHRGAIKKSNEEVVSPLDEASPTPARTSRSNTQPDDNHVLHDSENFFQENDIDPAMEEANALIHMYHHRIARLLPPIHEEYASVFPSLAKSQARLQRVFDTHQKTLHHAANEVLRVYLTTEYFYGSRICSDRWNIPYDAVKELEEIIEEPLGSIINIPYHIAREFGDKCNYDDDWSNPAGYCYEALYTSPITTIVTNDSSTASSGKSSSAIIPDNSKKECHVIIGYTDLHYLLNLAREDRPVDAVKKVRVVGIEDNPYCIARALVMLEMIKNTSDLESIIQVWHSILWNETTLQEFKTAVNKIYDEADDFDPLVKGSVRELIIAWRYYVSLQPQQHTVINSLKKWEEVGMVDAHATTYFQAAVSLARGQDRLEMLEYLTTGSLLSVMDMNDKTPVTGNYTMLINVQGVKPVHLSNGLSRMGVMETLHFIDPDTTLMIHLKSQILSKLSRLQNWMKNGTLKVTLRQGKVDVDTPNTHKIIRDLQPDFIHWSNLPDYFKPKIFHAIARNCSVETTLHLGYTSRWRLRVMGGHMLDYSRESRVKMWKDGQRIITSRLHDVDPHGIIILELHCVDAKNLMNHVLLNLFRHEWFEEYFMKNQGIECRLLADPMPVPDMKSGNSLFFAWSYDNKATIRYTRDVANCYTLRYSRHSLRTFA